MRSPPCHILASVFPLALQHVCRRWGRRANWAPLRARPGRRWTLVTKSSKHGSSTALNPGTYHRRLLRRGLGNWHRLRPSPRHRAGECQCCFSDSAGRPREVADAKLRELDSESGEFRGSKSRRPGSGRLTRRCLLARLGRCHSRSWGHGPGTATSALADHHHEAAAWHCQGRSA